MPQGDGGGADACVSPGAAGVEARVEADRPADVEARLAGLGAEDERARQQAGFDRLLLAAADTVVAGETSSNDSGRSIAAVPGCKAVDVAREREIPRAGLETDLRVHGTGAPQSEGGGHGKRSLL